MRTPAVLAALALAACTATAPPSAPPPAAAPPTPATATTAPPRTRLRYAPEPAAGAHHTLVSAGGRVYLYDDAGRLVSERWMPGGGWPSFRLGSDGRTVYVLVEHEQQPYTLWTYRGGHLAQTASPGGWYPRRFESGGVVYRDGIGDLVRDLPRSRARSWRVPDVDPYVPGAKSGRHGDDGPYADVLLVATLAGEPVAVHALLGRCAVTDFSDSRQRMLDAPRPYFLRLCGDAVVAPDGGLAVLVRDGGDYVTDRPDEIALVTVDPVTLTERRRVVLRRDGLGIGTDFPGRLVALPGGLAAVVQGVGSRWWVADLRGAKAVLHAIPDDLGYEVTAAGPDALYLWGAGSTVARVTVSTGRVERAALRLPGPVHGVLRVP
jgi:hypothetical protein